ncbi:MAG: Mfa1 fimbrilin C-terminal domain-containing protein [Muribaculaceae bacterium]|nr:Mfa1 fimbrilin C-terminal domain-containing protein [Muribaculaceae bacterium]
MKKAIFPLLLAGLMASCANEDLGNAGQNLSGDAVEAQLYGYLTVSMVAPGGYMTKANDDDQNYKYGTEDENYVRKIRFFFFDESGNPAQVRKNPTDDSKFYSFYDWDPTDNDNDYTPGDDVTTKPSDDQYTGETIESMLTTTIAISGPALDAEQTPVMPAQVLAVVNPNSTVLELVNPSLATVQAAVGADAEATVASPLTTIVDDFQTDLMGKGDFVMSNSVFRTGTSDAYAVNDAQSIDPEKHIQAKLEDSQKNPLVIYVERVLARLDLSVGIADSKKKTTDDGTIYDVEFEFNPVDPNYEDNELKPSVSEPTKIYAKLLGWTITSTPKESRLVKQIQTGWDDFNANQPWNATDFHRSFWAVNHDKLDDANSIKDNYRWNSYNDISGINNNTRADECFDMTKESAYMQENANPLASAATGANPSYPTKVLLAAQLVDGNGKPVTITQWGQQYYTIEGLKNLVAHMLNLYTGEGEDKEKVKPSDLDFMTSSYYKAKDRQPIGFSGGYISYFTLRKEKLSESEQGTLPSDKTWYHLDENDPTGEKYDEIEDVDKYLEDVLGYALVWNNGYTYYYFDVRHLGTDDKNMGYYGVVRNHIYDSTITTLKGLGTPVWDPKENIYPEHPDISGNLITAQIKVLMWRVVSQNYELVW